MFLHHLHHLHHLHRLSHALALLSLATPLSARQWVFNGIDEPVEAEFIAESNGYVVLRGSNEKSFEVPLANFSASDQQFIGLLSREPASKLPLSEPGKAIDSNRGYKIEKSESITGTLISPPAASQIHLTGSGDPLLGSSVNFTASDGWLFPDRIKPSITVTKFLDRMLVNGSPAELDKNIRVVSCGSGSVIIPHPPDFPALTLFEKGSLGGESKPFVCYTKYGAKDLE